MRTQYTDKNQNTNSAFDYFHSPVPSIEYTRQFPLPETTQKDRGTGAWHIELDLVSKRMSGEGGGGVRWYRQRVCLNVARVESWMLAARRHPS